MEIIELNNTIDFSQNKKLHSRIIQFEELLNELRKIEINEEIISLINTGIEEINTIHDAIKLRKLIRRTQSKIIQLVEKKHKIVTINHYRNTWLAIGMSVFGVPLGVVFGTMFENMGFIGIGMPIGMAIGIAIGVGMDKKAIEEGRQLNIELKF